eukprot:gene2194-1361_t
MEVFQPSSFSGKDGAGTVSHQRALSGASARSTSVTAASMSFQQGPPLTPVPPNRCASLPAQPHPLASTAARSSSRLFFPQSHLASAHHVSGNGTLYTAIITGGRRTCVRHPPPPPPSPCCSGPEEGHKGEVAQVQLQPSSRVVLFRDGRRMAESLPFSDYLPFVPLPGSSSGTRSSSAARSSQQQRNAASTTVGVDACDSRSFGWSALDTEEHSRGGAAASPTEVGRKATTTRSPRSTPAGLPEVVCALTPFQPRPAVAGGADECCWRILVGVNERGSLSTPRHAALLLFEYHPDGKRRIHESAATTAEEELLEQERGGRRLKHVAAQDRFSFPLPGLCGGVLQPVLLDDAYALHATPPRTAATTLSPDRVNVATVLQVEFLHGDWVCVLGPTKALVLDLSAGLGMRSQRADARTAAPPVDAATGSSAAAASSHPAAPRSAGAPPVLEVEELVLAPIIWQTSGLFQRFSLCPLPDTPHLAIVSSCGGRVLVFPHATAQDETMQRLLRHQSLREEELGGSSSASLLSGGGSANPALGMYGAINMIFEHYAREDAGEGRRTHALAELLAGGLLFASEPITLEVGPGFRARDLEWRVTTTKLLLCVPCWRAPSLGPPKASAYLPSSPSLNRTVDEPQEDPVLMLFELLLLPSHIFHSNLHRRIDINSLTGGGSTRWSLGNSSAGPCICPATTCNGTICGTEGEPFEKSNRQGAGGPAGGSKWLHLHVALIGIVPALTRKRPPARQMTQGVPASTKDSSVSLLVQAADHGHSVRWCSNHRTSPGCATRAAVRGVHRCGAAWEDEPANCHGDEWMGFVTPYLPSVEDPGLNKSRSLSIPVTGLVLFHLNGATGEMRWSQLKTATREVEHTGVPLTAAAATADLLPLATPYVPPGVQAAVSGATAPGEEDQDRLGPEKRGRNGAELVLDGASSGFTPLRDLIQSFGPIRSVVFLPYFPHKKAAIGGNPPSTADLLALSASQPNPTRQQQQPTTDSTAGGCASTTKDPSEGSGAPWGTGATPSLHAVMGFANGLLVHLQLLVLTLTATGKKRNNQNRNSTAQQQQQQEAHSAPARRRESIEEEEEEEEEDEVQSVVMGVVHSVLTAGHAPMTHVTPAHRFRYPACDPRTSSRLGLCCGTVLALQRRHHHCPPAATCTSTAPGWQLLVFRHWLLDTRRVGRLNSRPATAEEEEEEVGVILDGIVPFSVLGATEVHLLGGMCTPQGLCVALAVDAAPDAPPAPPTHTRTTPTHVLFVPLRSWLHTHLARAMAKLPYRTVAPAVSDASRASVSLVELFRRSRGFGGLCTSALALSAGIAYARCGLLRRLDALQEVIAITPAGDQEGGGEETDCATAQKATGGCCHGSSTTSKWRLVAKAAYAAAAASPEPDPHPQSPLATNGLKPSSSSSTSQRSETVETIDAALGRTLQQEVLLYLDALDTMDPERRVREARGREEKEDVTQRLTDLLQRLSRPSVSSSNGGPYAAGDVEWHVKTIPPAGDRSSSTDRQPTGGEASVCIEVRSLLLPRTVQVRLDAPSSTEAAAAARGDGSREIARDGTIFYVGSHAVNTTTEVRRPSALPPVKEKDGPGPGGAAPAAVATTTTTTTTSSLGPWRVLEAKAKILADCSIILGVLVAMHGDQQRAGAGAEAQVWMYGCPPVGTAASLADDGGFHRDAVLSCPSQMFELGDGGEVFLVRDHRRRFHSSSSGTPALDGVSAGVERWLRCVGEAPIAQGNGCTYYYHLFDVIPFPEAVLGGAGPSHALGSCSPQQIATRTRREAGGQQGATTTTTAFYNPTSDWGRHLHKQQDRSTAITDTASSSQVCEYGTAFNAFCLPAISWGTARNGSAASGGCRWPALAERTPMALLTDAGSAGLCLLPLSCLRAPGVHAGLPTARTSGIDATSAVGYQPDVLLQLIGLGSWAAVYRILRDLQRGMEIDMGLVPAGAFHSCAGTVPPARYDGQRAFGGDLPRWEQRDPTAEENGQRTGETGRRLLCPGTVGMGTCPADRLARAWSGLSCRDPGAARRLEQGLGGPEAHHKGQQHERLLQRATALGWLPQGLEQSRWDTGLSGGLPTDPSLNATPSPPKEKDAARQRRKLHRAAQRVWDRRRQLGVVVNVRLPEEEAGLGRGEWRRVHSVSLHSVFTSLEEAERSAAHTSTHRLQEQQQQGAWLAELAALVCQVRLTQLSGEAPPPPPSGLQGRVPPHPLTSFSPAQDLLLDIVKSLIDARGLGRSADEAAVRFYFFHRLHERRLERVIEQQQAAAHSASSAAADDAEWAAASSGIPSGGDTAARSVVSRQSAGGLSPAGGGALPQQPPSPTPATSSTVPPPQLDGGADLYPPYSLFAFASASVSPLHAAEGPAMLRQGDHFTAGEPSVAFSTGGEGNRRLRNNQCLAITAAGVRWLWAAMSDSHKVLLSHLFPASASAITGVAGTALALAGADRLGGGAALATPLTSAALSGVRSVPAQDGATPAPLQLSDLSRTGVAFWVKDAELLRSLVERLGYATYQHSQRDIPSCALYFILADRLHTLAALCKAQSNTRLEAFFQRDFSVEQHRSAASSNAFAAVSKNLWTYGMAFFILAGDAKSAAQVALQRLRDPAFALLVLRVAAHNEAHRSARTGQRPTTDLRDALDWYSAQRIAEQGSSCGLYSPWEVACVRWHYPKPPAPAPQPSVASASTGMLSSGLLASFFGGTSSSDDSEEDGPAPQQVPEGGGQPVERSPEEEDAQPAALRLLLRHPCMHAAALGQVRYAVVCISQVAQYERQLLQQDQPHQTNNGSTRKLEQQSFFPPLLPLVGEAVRLAAMGRWAMARPALVPLARAYYHAVQQIVKQLRQQDEEAESAAVEQTNTPAHLVPRAAGAHGQAPSLGGRITTASSPTAAQLQANFAAGTLAFSGFGASDSDEEPNLDPPPPPTVVHQDPAVASSAGVPQTETGTKRADRSKLLDRLEGEARYALGHRLGRAAGNHYYGDEEDGGSALEKTIPTLGAILTEEEEDSNGSKRHRHRNGTSSLRGSMASSPSPLPCTPATWTSAGLNVVPCIPTSTAGDHGERTAHRLPDARAERAWWSLLLPVLLAVLQVPPTSACPTAMPRYAGATSRGAVLYPALSQLLHAASACWHTYYWSDAAVEAVLREQQHDGLGSESESESGEDEGEEERHGTSASATPPHASHTARIAARNQRRRTRRSGWSDKTASCMCRFVFTSLAAAMEDETLASAVMQVPTSSVLLRAGVQAKQAAPPPSSQRTHPVAAAPIPLIAAYLVALRHFVDLYSDAATSKSEMALQARPLAGAAAGRRARKKPHHQKTPQKQPSSSSSPRAERRSDSSSRSSSSRSSRRSSRPPLSRCSSLSLGSSLCSSCSSYASISPSALSSPADGSSSDSSFGSVAPLPAQPTPGKGQWVNRFDTLEQEVQASSNQPAHLDEGDDGDGPQGGAAASALTALGGVSLAKERLMTAGLFDWFAATVYLDLIAHQLQPLYTKLQRASHRAERWRYRRHQFTTTAAAAAAAGGGEEEEGASPASSSPACLTHRSMYNEMSTSHHAALLGHLLVALRSAFVFTTLELQGVAEAMRHSCDAALRLQEVNEEEEEEAAAGGGGGGHRHVSLGGGSRTGSPRCAQRTTSTTLAADLDTANDGFLQSDRVLLGFLNSDIGDVEALSAYLTLAQARSCCHPCRSRPGGAEERGIPAPAQTASTPTPASTPCISPAAAGSSRLALRALPYDPMIPSLVTIPSLRSPRLLHALLYRVYWPVPAPRIALSAQTTLSRQALTALWDQRQGAASAAASALRHYHHVVLAAGASTTTPQQSHHRKPLRAGQQEAAAAAFPPHEAVALLSARAIGLQLLHANLISDAERRVYYDRHQSGLFTFTAEGSWSMDGAPPLGSPRGVGPWSPPRSAAASPLPVLDSSSGSFSLHGGRNPRTSGYRNYLLGSTTTPHFPTRDEEHENKTWAACSGSQDPFLVLRAIWFRRYHSAATLRVALSHRLLFAATHHHQRRDAGGQLLPGESGIPSSGGQRPTQRAASAGGDTSSGSAAAALLHPVITDRLLLAQSHHPVTALALDYTQSSASLVWSSACGTQAVHGLRDVLGIEEEELGALTEAAERQRHAAQRQARAAEGRGDSRATGSALHTPHSLGDGRLVQQDGDETCWEARVARLPLPLPLLAGREAAREVHDDTLRRLCRSLQRSSAGQQEELAEQQQRRTQQQATAGAVSTGGKAATGSGASAPTTSRGAQTTPRTSASRRLLSSTAATASLGPCPHRPALGTISSSSLVAHPRLPFFLAATADGHVDLFNFASSECVGSVRCPGGARCPCVTAIAFSNRRAPTQPRRTSMGPCGRTYRRVLQEALAERRQMLRQQQTTKEAAAGGARRAAVHRGGRTLPRKSPPLFTRVLRSSGAALLAASEIPLPDGPSPGHSLVYDGEMFAAGLLDGSIAVWRFDDLLFSSSATATATAVPPAGECGRRNSLGSGSGSTAGGGTSPSGGRAAPFLLLSRLFARGGGLKQCCFCGSAHLLAAVGEVEEPHWCPAPPAHLHPQTSGGLAAGVGAVGSTTTAYELLLLDLHHSLEAAAGDGLAPWQRRSNRSSAAANGAHDPAGVVVPSHTNTPPTSTAAVPCGNGGGGSHIDILFPPGVVGVTPVSRSTRLLMGPSAAVPPQRSTANASNISSGSAPPSAAGTPNSVPANGYGSLSGGRPAFTVAARVALPFPTDFAVYISGLHAVLCVAASGEMCLYQLTDGTLTIIAAEPLWLTRQRQQYHVRQACAAAAGLWTAPGGSAGHVTPWEHRLCGIEGDRAVAGVVGQPLPSTSATAATVEKEEEEGPDDSLLLSASPSLRITAVTFSEDEGVCALGTDDGVGYVLPTQVLQEYVYKLRFTEPPYPHPSATAQPQQPHGGATVGMVASAAEAVIPESMAMVLPPSFHAIMNDDTDPNKKGGTSESRKDSSSHRTAGSAIPASVDGRSSAPVSNLSRLPAGTLDHMADGASRHFSATVDATTAGSGGGSSAVGGGGIDGLVGVSTSLTSTSGVPPPGSSGSGAAGAPRVISAAHPQPTSLFTCINQNNFNETRETVTSLNIIMSPVSSSSASAGVRSPATNPRGNGADPVRCPLQSIYMFATPVLLAPLLSSRSGVRSLLFGPQVLLAGLQDGKVVAASLAPQAWRRAFMAEEGTTAEADVTRTAARELRGLKTIHASQFTPSHTHPNGKITSPPLQHPPTDTPAGPRLLLNILTTLHTPSTDKTPTFHYHLRFIAPTDDVNTITPDRSVLRGVNIRLSEGRPASSLPSSVAVAREHLYALRSGTVPLDDAAAAAADSPPPPVDHMMTVPFGQDRSSAAASSFDSRVVLGGAPLPETQPFSIPGIHFDAGTVIVSVEEESGRPVVDAGWDPQQRLLTPLVSPVQVLPAAHSTQDMEGPPALLSGSATTTAPQILPIVLREGDSQSMAGGALPTPADTTGIQCSRSKGLAGPKASLAVSSLSSSLLHHPALVSLPLLSSSSTSTRQSAALAVHPDSSDPVPVPTLPPTRTTSAEASAHHAEEEEEEEVTAANHGEEGPDTREGMRCTTEAFIEDPITADPVEPAAPTEERGDQPQAPNTQEKIRQGTESVRVEQQGSPVRAPRYMTYRLYGSPAPSRTDAPLPLLDATCADEISVNAAALPESFYCSICQSLPADLVRMRPCGHIFCDACIRACLKVSTTPSCPLDRTPLTAEDLLPDAAARAAVEGLHITCPAATAHAAEEADRLKMKRKQQRGAAAAAATSLKGVPTPDGGAAVVDEDPSCAGPMLVVLNAALGTAVRVMKYASASKDHEARNTPTGRRGDETEMHQQQQQLDDSNPSLNTTDATKRTSEGHHNHEAPPTPTPVSSDPATAPPSPDTSCRWQGRLGELARHLESECALALHPCPFAVYGCLAQLRRDEVVGHCVCCMPEHLDLLRAEKVAHQAALRELQQYNQVLQGRWMSGYSYHLFQQQQQQQMQQQQMQVQALEYNPTNLNNAGMTIAAALQNTTPATLSTLRAPHGGRTSVQRQSLPATPPPASADAARLPPSFSPETHERESEERRTMRAAAEAAEAAEEDSNVLPLSTVAEVGETLRRTAPEYASSPSSSSFHSAVMRHHRPPPSPRARSLAFGAVTGRFLWRLPGYLPPSAGVRSTAVGEGGTAAALHSTRSRPQRPPPAHVSEIFISQPAPSTWVSWFLEIKRAERRGKKDHRPPGDPSAPHAMRRSSRRGSGQDPMIPVSLHGAGDEAEIDPLTPLLDSPTAIAPPQQQPHVPSTTAAVGMAGRHLPTPEDGSARQEAVDEEAFSTTAPRSPPRRSTAHSSTIHSSAMDNSFPSLGPLFTATSLAMLPPAVPPTSTTTTTAAAAADGADGRGEGASEGLLGLSHHHHHQPNPNTTTTTIHNNNHNNHHNSSRSTFSAALPSSSARFVSLGASPGGRQTPVGGGGGGGGGLGHPVPSFAGAAASTATVAGRHNFSVSSFNNRSDTADASSFFLLSSSSGEDEDEGVYHADTATNTRVRGAEGTHRFNATTTTTTSRHSSVAELELGPGAPHGTEGMDSEREMEEEEEDDDDACGIFLFPFRHRYRSRFVLTLFHPHSPRQDYSLLVEDWAEAFRGDGWGPKELLWMPWLRHAGFLDPRYGNTLFIGPGPKECDAQTPLPSLPIQCADHSHADTHHQLRHYRWAKEGGPPLCRTSQHSSSSIREPEKMRTRRRGRRATPTNIIYMEVQPGDYIYQCPRYHMNHHADKPVKRKRSKMGGWKICRVRTSDYRGNPRRCIGETSSRTYTSTYTHTHTFFDSLLCFFEKEALSPYFRHREYDVLAPHSFLLYNGLVSLFCFPSDLFVGWIISGTSGGTDSSQKKRKRTELNKYLLFLHSTSENKQMHSNMMNKTATRDGEETKETLSDTIIQFAHSPTPSCHSNLCSPHTHIHIQTWGCYLIRFLLTPPPYTRPFLLSIFSFFNFYMMICISLCDLE